MNMLMKWYAAGVGLILVMSGCQQAPSSSAPRERTLENVQFPIADFQLTERSGTIIRNRDLKGKVWIASFIFSRCTGPCPQITRTMEILQKDFAQELQGDLRLVTFTVDPERDNPQELTAYAEHFHADPVRWLFLTGEEKTIRDLLQNSFKVAAERNEKSLKKGDEFNHSTLLALVDKKGIVRGYYAGISDPTRPDDGKEFEASLQRLRVAVHKLLLE